MKLPKINRQTIVAMIFGFILSQIYLHSGVLHSVMAFILVGAIPGTSHSLSPTVMLCLYAAIAWLFIFSSITRSFADTILKNRRSTKQRLPKRRLGRI